MKSINWIFSCLFLVEDISCNDAILSKFHQTGYKLRDNRIQLISYDENFFNLFEIKAFKYNRTTTAHNVTFNVKLDAKDQIEVVVQANKFLSNEYRHFPMRFQINMRKAIEADVIGMGSVKNCGNLTIFYLHKDVTYHACNFVMDETCFPPLMPDGKYRMNCTVTYLNTDVALMYVFFEVYTPIAYPKKRKFDNH